MSDHTFTEDEIEDLTDRVFLLKQHIEEGKLHFASHLAEGFRESYGAIRLRNDGRVDPTTVDGRIRAATLAIRHFKYRQEAKEAISLGDIQEAYFNLLDQQVGWLLERMKREGATPHQVGMALASNPEFASGLCSQLPEFAGELKEFWRSVSDSGIFHLQDGRQLKATFSGDLFPAYWENAVSTAGLYVDTIVLPCPVMRIAPLVGLYPDKQIAQLLTKHLLTALSYREIATANVIPPIALILPHPDDLTRGEDRGLISRSEPAILKHGEHLFGRKFAALDEFRAFCENLHTVEQVLAELKGRDRVLFDAQWEERGPEAQLRRVMREYQATLPGFDPTIAGNHIFAASMGRMPQALAAQESALHIGGSPLINAETSWQYYTWFLEYESVQLNSRASYTTTAHIARALSDAGRSLTWLGNVPASTVLEIRRKGQADELRQILGAGIDELIALNANDYVRTASQVVGNLSRAFEEHQRKLAEARANKIKLYGIDVVSCVATGAIAVTAALKGSPALGAVSGILSVAGLPNLRDLRSKFKEQAEEERLRKSSPTGLLFRHVTFKN